MSAPVFSLATYRQLIAAIVARGYQVVPAGIEPLAGKSVLYLRHDVDFSLQLAVELARVNAALGVAGCFHVPVHSPLMNLLAEPAQRALGSLHELGQAVALHFYLPAGYGAAAPGAFEDVTRLINAQHAALSRAAPMPILPALSWHNPSVLGARFADFVHAEVPGLLNLYTLNARGVRYLSDSNNRYTVDEWQHLIAELEGPTQLLFHPFQWVLGAPDMQRVLGKTWQHLIRQYEAVFNTNGVYQRALPAGLSERALSELVADLGRDP